MTSACAAPVSPQTIAQIVAHGVSGTPAFFAMEAARPSAACRACRNARCPPATRRLGEQVLQRRRHDLVVALRRGSSALPRVVVGDIPPAVMIDEIDGAVCDATSSAISSPSPTRAAAAPSPVDSSSGLAAFVRRFSAARNQDRALARSAPSASASAESPARCVAE